ncbi:hypothetical protein QUW37_04970 [Ligilactobacillus aviarius]|uniref:hypothetical protein n=1 Tax=Ligilactobacillus aviarius TaxID=1606 RepID=UPI0025A37CCD|nr:hypothetical protein [Ligilactobacillus aviarius]MDM8278579.1 hypothetical protein [Ligilactobacillus aviarius]
MIKIKTEKIPKYNGNRGEDFPVNLSELMDVEKMKAQNADNVFSNEDVRLVLEELSHE